MVWDIPERNVSIVELYFQTGSVVAAQRTFRTMHNCRKAPTRNTIVRLVNQFRETGSVVNLKRKRSRPSRDDENIERVSEEVQHAPQTSTRRISAQLSIPRTSLLRILHGDLGLRPYRIQLVQRLHRGDKKKRLEFCKWLLDKCRSNSHFCELMIMSDEADFHLDGRVNKQNCRLWSEESPHLMDEIENFSPKVSVWCGIMKDCVIGPYFFEDNNQPVTVNATRYCQMIKRYLIPQLRRRNLSINKLWFQ